MTDVPQERGKNQNVFQIHDNKQIEVVTKDVINKVLKSSWCVAEPNVHYQAFKMSKTGMESGLPLVPVGCAPDYRLPVDPTW